MHPDGSFFHLATWREVIERAFGHRTYYTFVERDGTITGILPLAQVKTLLFGNMLVSVPFCVYGGPLTVEAETAAALESDAESLMRRTDATAVEFRHRDPVESDWIERPELYVTFRKQIDPDTDKNLKAIPRKQRAMVRKGIQNGLVSVVGYEIEPLHRIYAESVRNLGTPVFSRRYFRILSEAFQGAFDILTVVDQGRTIAAVMNFYFREEVLPYYGGGTEEARKRAGNDFMYWEVMRRAIARGCRLFDFGRSKVGTGAHAFKHNWGFEPAPLHYRFKVTPGKAIPDHNPLNPKYRIFVNAWKHLPLPVANAIGPYIVRGIG
jgi:FemAB-related protein (PEP-CTERM system-associated)